MNEHPPEKSRAHGGLDMLMSVVIWILIAVIAFAGGAMYQEGRIAAEEAKAADEFDTTILKKAHQYIKGKYVASLEGYDEEILYGAIRGMVGVLHDPPFNDPYSGFFDPSRFKGLEAETTGHYAGIGIRIDLSVELGIPQISSVFRGSPAAEAGLKKDDFITKVDGKSMDGLSLEEVGRMILGEEGTKVVLSITDPITFDERDIDVYRAIVTIHSVEEARMLAPGVGYIMLSSFSENTTTEMSDALKDLDKLGLKKLILDLRGNGGGTLENAVDIASMFLKNDDVVTTLVYRIKEGEAKRANSRRVPDGKTYDVPIVILVDGGSASASEILAGALRDHKRAILVGDKTFGKGKVQEIIQISNREKEVALVLTVAKYFTPAGHDIDGEGGIEPDVKITFEDMKTEISEIGKMEAEMDALRSKLLKYRNDLMDKILEHDVVLERVKTRFDAILAEGVKNRDEAIKAAEEKQSSEALKADESAEDEDKSEETDSSGEAVKNGASNEANPDGDDESPAPGSEISTLHGVVC